ncbi:MAG: IS200/IS605 family transposase [Candidatus Cloacimonetes bacterium]|nr:IS200/IS605 family transposase [Candidatus Cloacimonadota bacterium]
MKPGTFTQLYIHLVFAVEHRDSMIRDNVKEDVIKIMSSIINNMKHKTICINTMPDHIHILLGLNPSLSLSETVKELKRGSTFAFNEIKLFPCQFNWQSGYGAFSYSRSQLDSVCKYIQNQEKHHHKISFREEYQQFLEKFKIEYNKDYLFIFHDK